MPASKKRKISDDSKSHNRLSSGPALPMTAPSETQETSASENPNNDELPSITPSDSETVDKGQERKDRFKALQARAVSHSSANLFESYQKLLPTTVLYPHSEVRLYWLMYEVEEFRATKPQRCCRGITTSSDRPEPPQFSCTEASLCIT